MAESRPALTGCAIVEVMFLGASGPDSHQHKPVSARGPYGVRRLFYQQNGDRKPEFTAARNSLARGELPLPGRPCPGGGQTGLLVGRGAGESPMCDPSQHREGLTRVREGCPAGASTGAEGPYVQGCQAAFVSPSLSPHHLAV